jgi:hypothetical protein
LVRKEELKTSKRVYIKNVEGEEVKYLLNTTDETYNSLIINKPVKYEVEGDWKGIPIIKSLSFEFDTNKDKINADFINKMYGPKPVPKLKEIMEEMVDFVNSTNDPSNIGGGPRVITFDCLRKAICDYLTDTVIVEEGGKPVYVTKNRLNDFMNASASTHYHDSQEGGLIRHIAKMVSICVGMFKAKFQTYECHPLTIMIGIFVHDIGKIDQYVLENGEYKAAEDSFYRGSHIGLGLNRWAINGRKFLEDLEVRPIDIEKIYWDVWHMIGSHHGPVENKMGSAWNPFGHDAWTLHSIDLLESRQEEGLKPIRTE